jgi:hypothetical protein
MEAKINLDLYRQIIVTCHCAVVICVYHYHYYCCYYRYISLLFLQLLLPLSIIACKSIIATTIITITNTGLMENIYYRLVGPWIGFKTVTVGPRYRYLHQNRGYHCMAVPTAVYRPAMMEC